MRASQIKSLQDSVFGGLGEDFEINPRDKDRQALIATGIWFAEGSERAGPTDVELRTEADEIVFRRDDTAAVAALSGEFVEIKRVDTGVIYVVQGLGELRSHKHSVRVTEDNR